ncbi:hypothetical protein [Cyclobacterium qasimii]|uniref:hypothetical protein n=1 Tax=Cyclobacterium qasimii TaxID=1350429 RepID=UPI001377A0FF|nr:hypothetical protein [Cyclobacterium qasimii]
MCPAWASGIEDTKLIQPVKTCGEALTSSTVFPQGWFAGSSLVAAGKEKRLGSGSKSNPDYYDHFVTPKKKRK